MKIATGFLSFAAAAILPSLSMAITTFSVLSNNVYFLNELISPDWGQQTRAKLIAESDYIKGHDVIVLQECFSKRACDILREGLRSQYPYQTPTLGVSKEGWDSTSGYYHWSVPLNGGVVIMSKWPITQKHQYVFKNGCASEWFQNKGFAYAVLNYQGKNVHVFGTHMQSDDSACLPGQPARYRGQALDAWRSYIDSLNIPANELVIMAGDFNIKRDTEEFSSMLKRLNATQPTVYDGHPWTWDTQTNEIARYNYPDLIPEYLDFVVTDKEHLAVKSSVQTTLKVQSPEYHIKGAAYHEYSDHYPVKTVIEADL